MLAAHVVASSSGCRRGVCLVIGAGAGIGVHVARRFSRAGLVACIVRRSEGEDLQHAVEAIRAEGGEAQGYLKNVVEPGAIEGLVSIIEADVGEIQVAIYNLGAQIGSRTLESTSLKAFELGWKLGCEGLFRLAKAVAPHMSSRGRGSLLVTSSTAAVRGNAGQHSHAAAMGARRNLCQSLHHELGPKGIHVCHFIVDGAVNSPDTLGKLLGRDAFEKWIADAGDGVLSPVEIAETFFHVATQHRSAWTFELDLRPYNVPPWWNS